jgi:hypothetical protein
MHLAWCRFVTDSGLSLHVGVTRVTRLLKDIQDTINDIPDGLNEAQLESI